VANGTVVERISLTNLRLAEAFLERASDRLTALDALRHEADFADVIREARDIVTLCMRGMLRIIGIEVSRWVDVGEALTQNMSKLPPEVTSQKDRILGIYLDLTRERQVEFSEDIPIEKILAADADRALAEAEWFLELAQLTIDIVSRRRVPSPQS
jgi:HEPN domain-containing protein